MKIIKKTCLFCNKEFEASLKEHKRGNANYCSISCSSKRSRVSNENNVTCSLCEKEFYIVPSKLTNSKSGLYFCCREHKDQAQRIGGIEAIQPDHYGEGISSYRAIAFRVYPHKCNKCGYDKYPQILEVHHIDINHNNASIENLEILCGTCHDEIHFLSKTGKWR